MLKLSSYIGTTYGDNTGPSQLDDIEFTGIDREDINDVLENDNGSSGYYVANPMGFGQALYNYTVGSALPIGGGALAGAIIGRAINNKGIAPIAGTALGAGIGGFYALKNIANTMYARDQSKAGKDLLNLRSQLYEVQDQMERARRSAELIKLEAQHRLQNLREKYPRLQLEDFT
jgi:hypothetical protein